VPVAELGVVIAGAVLLVNIAAAPLTWKAARVDAARALRAE
jgi:ABC-type lipoprotein release transport system permease subunit